MIFVGLTNDTSAATGGIARTTSVGDTAIGISGGQFKAANMIRTTWRNKLTGPVRGGEAPPSRVRS